jgi:anaerobic ribonucleoside-triphosphate reductase activating protein
MPSVQLFGTIFPSLNATEGIAVELYLSGCGREPKCEGCHNPLLWDFHAGETVEVEELVTRLLYRYRDADSIAIMGGEPLNQPHILELLQEIHNRVVGKPIWLYTSYELNEIDLQVLAVVDYIKTGRFDASRLTPYGSRLASRNQTIYKKGNANGYVYFEEFYTAKGK